MTTIAVILQVVNNRVVTAAPSSTSHPTFRKPSYGTTRQNCLKGLVWCFVLLPPMLSPTEGHGQASTADIPSMDITSDVEIIEIGDSPVKGAGPPKSSHQRRKPLVGHKTELQVAPMFTQMASGSTSTGTPLKRKRFSVDGSAKPALNSSDQGIKQSDSFTEPSPISKGVRIDPLKAVQP